MKVATRVKTMTPRCDLGDEYFEGDLSELVKAVTTVALQDSMDDSPTQLVPWDKQASPPKKRVSLETLVATFAKSVGGFDDGEEFAGTQVHLGTLLARVQALACNASVCTYGNVDVSSDPHQVVQRHNNPTRLCVHAKHDMYPIPLRL